VKVHGKVTGGKLLIIATFAKRADMIGKSCDEQKSKDISLPCNFIFAKYCRIKKLRDY